MLSEFIDASINFTNADIFKMYGVIVVISFVIVVYMFKSSQKDD